MPRGHYTRQCKPISFRLFTKVNKTPTCWLWFGTTTTFGHGSIMCDRTNGEPRKLVPVHRVAWELAHGPIPQGMCVLHRCDIPNCVNPEHLFLGTKAENSADMCAKGRQKNGEALPQAKLKERDISAIRASNEKQSVLAAKYAISQGHVSVILSRKLWKHVR